MARNPPAPCRPAAALAATESLVAHPGRRSKGARRVASAAAAGRERARAVMYASTDLQKASERN